MYGAFMLQDHSGAIVFDTNTFNDNISYKGVIQISKITGPIVIQGNTFTSNAALVNSNAISIQMGVSDFEDSDEISSETSDPVCGGISLTSNTFTSNLGCTQVSGIANIQCLKPADWVYSD